MSNDDRNVFSSRRNVVSDGAFLTDGARLFHARAKATCLDSSHSLVNPPLSSSVVCRYCIYSVVTKMCFVATQGRHIAPINVKFGTGSSPLLRAKFHVYWCRNVGIWPKTVKIWNFADKFAPRGRLVCTIITNFSAFMCISR